jgi:tetraacyldisaccharide 4'-kinase
MLPFNTFFHFFVPNYRKLRPVKWLYPFGSIYGWGLQLRNQLYNKGIFHSEKSPVFAVCIGNLALGGTGKTPLTEYMIRLYKESGINVAVLSRGYKRKTKGFLQANLDSTIEDLGDEAYQIYQKFSDVKVFVNEKRVEGVNRIYGENPEIEIILLDDAFQHRAIQANKNILVTRYDRLYTSDLYVPAGRLRDHVIRANDADIVMVSNCPDELDVMLKNKVTGKLKLRSNQKLFFSGINYQEPKRLFKADLDTSDEKMTKCIAVTGIANPEHFINYLDWQYDLIKHFKYPDHYDFSDDNVLNWLDRLNKEKDAFIVTTEKDATRIHKYEAQLRNIPIYVIPISVNFFGDEKRFNEMCLSWVKKT